MRVCGEMALDQIALFQTAKGLKSQSHSCFHGRLSLIHILLDMLLPQNIGGTGMRPKPYPFYCRLGFAVGCGRLSSPASRTTWLRAAPACLQAEFLLALCRFLVGMKCILPDARRSAATFLCRRNIKIRQKKDRRFFECW